MTTRKRIAVAIATDGDSTPAFLLEQTAKEHLPVEWVVLGGEGDLDTLWRERCRVTIRACDGFVGLISPHTALAERQHWAIVCAQEEGRPLLLMCVDGESPDRLLPSFGLALSMWSWPSLKIFIDGVWYTHRLGQR